MKREVEFWLGSTPGAKEERWRHVRGGLQLLQIADVVLRGYYAAIDADGHCDAVREPPGEVRWQTACPNRHRACRAVWFTAVDEFLARTQLAPDAMPDDLRMQYLVHRAMSPE